MVNFNPGRGSEQTGVRPALSIQNDIGNQYASTTVVAAITTTIKKYPVTVLLAQGKGGLKQSSMVNLAQILTIDKGRLIKKLGHVGDDKMKEIDEAIKVSLGI
jgi:mRNA interferase MazF